MRSETGGKIGFLYYIPKASLYTLSSMPFFVGLFYPEEKAIIRRWRDPLRVGKNKFGIELDGLNVPILSS
jgi:hypothetical protein